jgi:hypothetical protein
MMPPTHRRATMAPSVPLKEFLMGKGNNRDRKEKKKPKKEKKK